MRTIAITRACTTVLLLVWTATAQGVPLAPGVTVVGPPEPDPTGGNQVADLLSPFASPPGTVLPFTGMLRTRVIANDPSNPFGGLTFTFELQNDASSQGSIKSLLNTGFAGFFTDVSYHVPSAGMPPFTVDRDLTGNDVTWNYTTTPGGSGLLAPGTSSSLLVIQTDATQFTFSNFASVIGSTVAVPSIGPAVPEPSGLSAVVIAALALRRRCRRA